MTQNLSSAVMRLQTADEIREFLHRDENAAVCGGNIAVCDKASLFTAFAYLSEKPADDDKDALRLAAYKAFFTNDRSRFEAAWQCADSLGTDRAAELNIRVLKGGFHKIKDYCLESSDLNDMRGASVLLSHVGESVIPDEIAAAFIPECIIYRGGGNIFAVLPESTPDSFAAELENIADRLLVSAGTAFFLSAAMPASAILGSGYARNMTAVEERLDERRKLKIHNIIRSRSEYYGETLRIKLNEKDSFGVYIKADETLDGQTAFCEACGKRFAAYRLGRHKLCAGCLHKRCVGKAAENGKYHRIYKEICGCEPKHIRMLSDIDEDRTAVVCGDGNNMGGIIGSFTIITEMMKFSRTVNTILSAAVFESMRKNRIDRFEVAALGGDDIFVIVPAKNALSFAADMIDIYNGAFSAQAFGAKSTLSAGVCAAKTSAPVKIMLETAEKMLADAKEYEKKRTPDERCGSIAFRILDSYSVYEEAPRKNIDGETAFESMQPYSLTTAKALINISRKFGGAARSRIRNLLDAFRAAGSTAEAELFFKYLNAKANPADRITLPEISGFAAENGYYTADGRYYYIWSEIIDIQSIAEGK